MKNKKFHEEKTITSLQEYYNEYAVIEKRQKIVKLLIILSIISMVGYFIYNHSF